VEQSFDERDARFDEIASTDDVILWFEPDLYDQLQLCEVLARLAERDSANRPLLSIVPADCLLGPLDPSAFPPLFEGRRALGEAELQLGIAAWKEITCSDPASITKAASLAAESQPGTRYAASSTLTLPHLAPALIRWLEELPSFENGLNRSEQQICSVLHDGPRTLGDTYRRSHHDVEEWIWMGDWSFAWYVQQLSDVETPLITYGDGSRVTAESMQELSREFFSARRIHLTDFGGEVLHRHADAIDENGIDRWFGGARLLTTDHWRWDASTRLAVSRRSERRHLPRG
jgi:hypothetical protein